MCVSKLLLIIVATVPTWPAAAWAQGTKDPSYLGPTMGFPIRPRDEPPGSTATPNTSHTQPQRTMRLHRIHRYPAYRARIK
ncbi:hypothetical protein [Bradyrhizobium sp. dw_78]|uniref:hypothetical protein n=1 Tax=Bradyrhizobium sp. dw_78 TaxID=2719793 RepID=UPI001BD3EBC8|nr:hypothetical protein [Bradyrhizobium sp. dw_78]